MVRSSLLLAVTAAVACAAATNEHAVVDLPILVERQEVSAAAAPPKGPSNAPPKAPPGKPIKPGTLTAPL